jgi:hypothetical protein
MLAELRSVGGAMNLPELGDGSLLGYAHADAGAARIASSFGQLFADQLEELRTGEWSGPIESAFGVHLVFVDAKIERRLPALAEVREAVERDWRFARRGEASKGFHAEILARYRVEVEWPEDRLALPRVESDPVPPR